MTSTQHARWLADGRPFRLARPLARLRDRLRAAGYTVYDIGNADHLDHQPPEDHTPYSATGWPVASPYGVGCAIDIMPPPARSGLPSLQVLGGRLVADRTSRAAGFIKYINWGPQDDRHAVQDRWQPDHSRRVSSDIGHIHVSQYSDMVNSTAYDSYDPLARSIGGPSVTDWETTFRAAEPTPAPADISLNLALQRVYQMLHHGDMTGGYTGRTFPNSIYAVLARLETAAAADATRDMASTAAITALADAIRQGGGSVDAASIIAEVRAQADQTRDMIETLQERLATVEQERDELLARLSEAFGSGSE